MGMGAVGGLLQLPPQPASSPLSDVPLTVVTSCAGIGREMLRRARVRMFNASHAAPVNPEMHRQVRLAASHVPASEQSVLDWQPSATETLTSGMSAAAAALLRAGSNSSSSAHANATPCEDGWIVIAVEAGLGQGWARVMGQGCVRVASGSCQGWGRVGPEKPTVEVFM